MLNDREIQEKASALGIDLSFGHVDGDGRFVVYKVSMFPAARAKAMALRSRVVWWLATGDALSGIEYGIHHRNRNRLDDRIENLEKLLQVDHGRLHNPKVFVTRQCLTCHKDFQKTPYRIRSESQGQFCSQQCYRSRTLTEAELQKCRERMDKAHEQRRGQTACPNGHPYDEKNTKITAVGRRLCKTCATNKSKRYQKRQRERLACHAS
jgi:hypothetical protein